jgi:hypothetical protein
MSPNVQENSVAFPPTHQEEPEATHEMRYMRRRRVNKSDRNGDPLDGLVNLWDLALVLAVAFLLAALSGVGLSGLLADDDMMLVKDPGQPDMKIITKKGTTVEVYDFAGGTPVTASGELIGQFYRLPDGSVVYVPTGTMPATPAPSTYPTPGVSSSPVPTPYPTPIVTPTPTPFQTATPPPAYTPAPAPAKKGGGTTDLTP